MSAAIIIKKVFHVFKKFYMSTLVAGDGNALRIFLNCTFYNFCYRTVMTEMNDLSPFGLHNATHNINSGIMPIEKGCGGNDPDFVDRILIHSLQALQNRTKLI